MFPMDIRVQAAVAESRRGERQIERKRDGEKTTAVRPGLDPGQCMLLRLLFFKLL